MLNAKQQRRAAKIYGWRQPLTICSVPKGRSAFVIYAVSLREHQGVTKVGRTTRWDQRRIAYANWNLSSGDGIYQEKVFTITEEFVDLPKLEAHILTSLPFSLRHGSEWFNADIEEVAKRIDQILCDCGLSFV